MLQEQETKTSKNRHEEENAQDPLDDTRIHPEDYELARKMATDALELDEEDIHDEHPSHVVTLIMRDPDNEKKLSELMEGVIDYQFIADEVPNHAGDVIKKGQTLDAVIIDIKPKIYEEDSFIVELSSRAADTKNGDDTYRRVRHDEAWDHVRYDKDREVMDRKKRAEVDRTRRVIKHPNFHNFNAVQAEAYLEKQQRGDVIVRPSSKGTDHLAVTWKVDDGLYQHIGKLFTSMLAALLINPWI